MLTIKPFSRFNISVKSNVFTATVSVTLLLKGKPSSIKQPDPKKLLTIITIMIPKVLTAVIQGIYEILCVVHHRITHEVLI